MSEVQLILFKSLVRTYYRKYAGRLVFLFFIMIVAVGRANEAGLLEYHYSLIKAMLTNPGIFLLVCLAWLLYAMNCQQFVAATIRSPEFSFLYNISLLNETSVYSMLLGVQFILFLPVTLYMLVIVGVGFHKHWQAQTLVVIFYVLAICFISARWYLFLLQNPGRKGLFLLWRLPSLIFEKFYWSFFIRYAGTKRKLLFLLIKIYNCGTLYLILQNQNMDEYDLRMVYLFFSFGVLGHGVLIHQFRELEDTRLTFYRGLPVSLLGRWIQYGSLYFLLFIPEMMTIRWLTPGFLHYRDAFLMLFFGYAVLLLLNSILFIRSFRMVDYLKIIVGIFFLVFIGVLTGNILWISVFSFGLSIYIFVDRYYRYEL